MITEKDYPLQRVWFTKFFFTSLLNAVFSLLLILFFVLLRSYHDRGDLSGPTPIERKFYIIFLIPPFILFILFRSYVILRRVSFRFCIKERFLTLEQGVISKQRRYIPYGVIQHVSVSQDLFDKVLGLASLTLENASWGGGASQPGEERVFGVTTRQPPDADTLTGFAGNKISIPGLKIGDAEALRKVILKKIEECPIEDSRSGL